MLNLNINYVIALLGSFGLTLVLVPVIRHFALANQIIDKPNLPRKVHQQPIPLLGGTAIIISVLVMLIFGRIWHLANFDKIPDSYILSVIVSCILILIGGYLDDKYNLKPWQQIIWPLMAAGITLLAGINISYITNPFGGPDHAIIYLGPIVSYMVTFIWLMGMMYTTKILDGLDGLVTGMTAIASFYIFILSLSWDISASATSFWSLALLGACLSFLIFNWQPAKIFLGEGGSVAVGFLLGILSIISGSKIITTLLIIGLPILDLIWVIIQRLLAGQSPFRHADNKHLHYQLLKIGLSKRQVVLIFYLIALVFGSLAVMSTSLGKLISLSVLIILMVTLSYYLHVKIQTS